MPELAIPRLPSLPSFQRSPSRKLSTPNMRKSLDKSRYSVDNKREESQLENNDLTLRRRSSLRSLRRSNTQPSSPAIFRLLSLQLAAQPYVSLLLHNYTPHTWRSDPPALSVHTASSAHGDWQCISTHAQLPCVLRVPCQSFQLDTRLIRICVRRRQRGEVGACIVRTRQLLSAHYEQLESNVKKSNNDSLHAGVLHVVVHAHQAGGIARLPHPRKIGSIVMQAAVGASEGVALSLSLTAGISMEKEIRGCTLELQRVAVRRGEVLHLGSSDFERGEAGKRANVFVQGAILCFGMGVESENSAIRRGVILGELVRGSRFGRRTVVGIIWLPMKRLISGWEVGEQAQIRWAGGDRFAVVDRYENRGDEVHLDLRITR